MSHEQTIIDIINHFVVRHPELKQKLNSLFDQSILKKDEDKTAFADINKLGKATSYLERYREIVSDPLNLLIGRVPAAGYVDDQGLVVLHNGNKVPLKGDLAYYSEFSDIFIINRGVHEPLEEYSFQEVLKKITSDSPVMLELGAYWGHYSMWMLKTHQKARCFLVEPDSNNIECGKNNFRINAYAGEFMQAFVGGDGFSVDHFANERSLTSLDVLHADIQGYEIEMLNGAENFLSAQKANYVFISTHSEELHINVVNKLIGFGYRIEVSSGFDEHTTSCDGFVLASSPKVGPVFESFNPLGRVDIANASPQDLLASVTSALA